MRLTWDFIVYRFASFGGVDQRLPEQERNRGHCRMRALWPNIVGPKCQISPYWHGYRPASTVGPRCPRLIVWLCRCRRRGRHKTVTIPVDDGRNAILTRIHVIFAEGLQHDEEQEAHGDELVMLQSAMLVVAIAFVGVGRKAWILCGRFACSQL
jgi:hypothetical protein